MQTGLHTFSKHLFWDVDRNNIDLKENERFIIKRVLEYGLLNDWRTLIQIYGLGKIYDVSITIKDIDKKTACFISSLCNSSKKNFKCYSTTQSNQLHWNF